MIKLTKDKKYEMLISEKGAEVKSFKVNKRFEFDVEYIWNGDKNYWGRSTPVLFPIVGKLKDNKYMINNEFYILPQHGLLRDREFKVTKQINNLITLEDTFDLDTLKIYPFKYKVEITHEIVNNGFITIFKVINIDEKPIYFNIGGHPGFMIDLPLSDYRIDFEKEESFISPKIVSGLLDFSEGVKYEKIIQLKLNHTMFNVDTIVIPKINSSYVCLTNDTHNIKFSFKNFKSLALWTLPSKEAPYLCLEPWNGYASKISDDYDFFKKDDLIKIDAYNEFFICSYKMEIL